MKDPHAVIGAVLIEIARQHELKAAGKFPWVCSDHADPRSGDVIREESRLVVLAEEFGEVAKAVCDGDEEHTRGELIQVAAVCLSWLGVVP